MVEMFRFVRSVEGIDEYLLPNGLKVLLLKDDSQQTVTVNITYMVGSRHEGRGEAGMAHLLEHMLFKGSPKFPNPKAVLQDKGAIFNATTWFDRTNYYETLPATSANLEFALEFEADRMLNSWIRAEDLASEMTVVRNEFEMGENDTIRVLHDQVFATAYRWHNYAQTTIGNRSDIERVPVGNLKHFYQHYYQPDNATLMVAGSFDHEEAKNLIAKYFGNLSKPNRLLDSTYTEEPTQDGPRHVVLKRVGEISTCAVAYHIPAGSHQDYPSVKLLVDILTHEPSGRIYKSLVETQRASEIFGASYALYEPGMLMAFAKPNQISETDEILQLLIREMECLDVDSLTQEELDRARNRSLKKLKLAMADSKDFTLRLTEFISMGDYRLFFWFRDQISKITLEDIKRVAKTYLLESNRTSGIFVPTSSPSRALIPITPNVAQMLEAYSGSQQTVAGESFEASIENIEKHVVRTSPTPHLRFALLNKKTRQNSVRARLIFRFGSEATLTGRTTALRLLPDMLIRGTKRHTYEQVLDALDKTQSSLQLFSGIGSLNAAINSDRENLQSVSELLHEILRTPAFSASEFELLKSKELADLAEHQTDPQSIAFNRIERHKNPWPKSSIHYVPSLDEQVDDIKNLKLDEIVSLYTDLFGASKLDISIVGDFEQDKMINVIQSAFDGWRSLAHYERVKGVYVPANLHDEEIQTPDKQMAFVTMALNLPLQDTSPDYPALRLAHYIFGESMKSRLMMRIREKEGLSYGTGSHLDVSRYEENASITMYAMTAPENAYKTRSIMQEEYARWVGDGVSQTELEEAKTSFWSFFGNLLANDGFLVKTFAGDLEARRTLAFYEEMFAKINLLTGDEIRQALQTHLGNAKLACVVAGDLH